MKLLDRKDVRLDVFERLTLATIAFLVLLLGASRCHELYADTGTTQEVHGD